MHRLLERQLRRHQLDAATLPPELRELLSDVSVAYDQSDGDRALMMRSLEIASQEQTARSQELQERNRELIAAQNTASQIAGQLQMALDGACMGPWSWNIFSGEATLSPRCSHICGLADSETHSLDQLISAIYHADRPRFSMALEAAQASREFVQLVRFQHPTGEIRWLRFLGKMDPSSHWMHGIARDVTDEAKGAELRDALAAIVASANVAIASVSMDGEVLTWNDGATKLFGLSADEVIGRHISMFVAPEDKEWLAADMAAAKMGESPAPIETRFSRQDGQEIFILLNISALHDPRADVEGFSIVIQDITAHTRAARIESERNALATAVTKLEDAMAVVAHELRTPLAGIRATVELLLERSAPQRTDNFLHSVLDSVVQTSRVVNDLLEITRIKNGVAMWHWEEFELASALDAAVSCLGMAARSTAVHFQAIVDPPEITMHGDRDAITRLIVNFTNNALKFTTRGLVRVEITPATGDDGAPMIHIVISDTGKGMSPEILERLGEPFALNSGLIGESFTSGTGLGVAICKGIIEAHGGKIHVQSEHQQGTTIDVLLRTDLKAPVGAKTNAANTPHKQEVAV